jgi:hypothetical protein
MTTEMLESFIHRLKSNLGMIVADPLDRQIDTRFRFEFEQDGVAPDGQSRSRCRAPGRRQAFACQFFMGYSRATLTPECSPWICRGPDQLSCRCTASYPFRFPCTSLAVGDMVVACQTFLGNFGSSRRLSIRYHRRPRIQ